MLSAGGQPTWGQLHRATSEIGAQMKSRCRTPMLADGPLMLATFKLRRAGDERMGSVLAAVSELVGSCALSLQECHNFMARWPLYA